MIATPTPPGVDPSTFKFVVNGRVVYEPFAKQVEYHQCRARYPLYGGSKGCGKSIAIRFDNYGPCLAVPGLQCLILRRQLEELKRSHLRFVAQEAQLLGAKWKPSDVGAGVLYFPNGSLIEFGHCNHEDNINNYLSAQYGRISFDEIITFSELMYLLIRTSCRTTIPDFIPRVGGGTNPVSKKKSVGYWAKRRWILRDLTDREDERYRGGAEYAYIKALPSDNPHLNWEQYEAELASLPPHLRAAYRDGDWDASEDGFFGEFRKLDQPDDEEGKPRKRHVVEFPWFPPSIPRHCGFDWGYMTDEGVCLWAVYGDDGHLYVEDEFVFNGTQRTRYIVKQIAEQVAEKNRTRGLDVRRIYCDPKMDAAEGHESVETKLDTFKKHVKSPCERGERDRVNGWSRFRAWLSNHPDGTPFLKVHPRCKSLIRSIGEAAVDDHNDEDLDTNGYDHPIDALRFLVASRAAPVEVHEKRAPKEGTVGAMVAAAIAAANRPSPLGHLNVQGARHHG
jgi:phage terminase large subunit